MVFASRVPMMIHFPPAFGLRPRLADDYDRDCFRLFTATRAKNHRAAASILARIFARYGRSADVEDCAIGHGETMARCEFRPVG